MALLQMINSVRGKLREERITSISATDYLTTEIIDLINDAASEILEAHNWSFDVRHDGLMYWPQNDSGTDAAFGATPGGAIYDALKTVSLAYLADSAVGEVFYDEEVAGHRMTDPFYSKIIPTATTDTAWGIAGIEYTVNAFTLTLTNNLDFTPTAVGTDAAWTTYSNEQMLPSTVRQVLSVRNEDRDIPIQFVNRDVEFENLVPRVHGSYSDSTEVIFVGSNVTTTARSGSWPTLTTQAAQTGLGAMIWPVPESDQHLHYSYRVQHTDLSSATDEFAGVPNNIIHLIEWRAVQMCYESGIQNDPVRARQAERQVEKRLLRALGSDTDQPNLRRIPTTYRPRLRGSLRRRWDSQTITAPS